MLTAKQLDYPSEGNLKNIIRTSRIPDLEGQSKILTYISLGDVYAAQFKGKADSPESETDIFEAILISVIAQSNLSLEKIKQPSRKQDVVRARCVIAWVTRWTTRMTHKKIGIALSSGKRKDHSTIVNAIRCAYDRIKSGDEYFMDLYNRVIEHLLYRYGIDVLKYDKPEWYIRMINK